MHALHAGQHGRNHGASEFVHEPAEKRVFLRWSTDDRHRPDRPVAVPDMRNTHHGKIMPARIVAQMIAKRPFRFRGTSHHRAFNDEVCFGVDGRPVCAGNHRNAMAGEHTGKCQLGKALGQRHHCRDGKRRCATHKNRHLEPLSACHRRRMVHADAAVELVVQANLMIALVFVATQLHAVHAEIGVLRAGVVGIFGVNDWQRDEGATVVRPTGHLWQTGEGNFVGQHRTPTHAFGQHGERIVWRSPVPPWLLQRFCWVDFEFYQSPDTVEGIGEDPFNASLGSIKIDEHGKGRAMRFGKQHGRATCAKQPPLNFRYLQVWIDRMIDLDKLPLGAQGRDTGLKSFKSHRGNPPMVVCRKRMARHLFYKIVCILF